MELIASSFDIIYNIDWLNSIHIIKTKENTIYLQLTQIKTMHDYVRIINEFIKTHIYSTDPNLLNFQTEINAFDQSNSKHRIIKFITDYVNLQYKICPFFDIKYCVIINIKNTSNGYNYVLVTGGPGFLSLEN